ENDAHKIYQGLNGGNDFKYRETYKILAREPRWANLRDVGLNHAGNVPRNIVKRTLDNSSLRNSVRSNNLSEDLDSLPTPQSVGQNSELDGSLQAEVMKRLAKKGGPDPLGLGIDFCHYRLPRKDEETTIKRIVRISEEKLVVREWTVLTNVPDNIISTLTLLFDPPWMVFFEDAVYDESKSRYFISLGTLKEYLTSPVQVNVGKVSSPTTNVSQLLEKVADNEKGLNAKDVCIKALVAGICFHAYQQLAMTYTLLCSFLGGPLPFVKRFSYAEIKKATGGFSSIIVTHSDGSVYKAQFRGGLVVVVKEVRIFNEAKDAFNKEVELLMRLHRQLL
ncbi:hypothetical protein GIB67_030589, partial [Kingdonia uniflora]